jgi:hypothetical protein
LSTTLSLIRSYASLCCFHTPCDDVSEAGCGLNCTVLKARSRHLISKNLNDSVDDIHHLVGSCCVQNEYGKILTGIFRSSHQATDTVLLAQELADLPSQVPVQVPHSPILTNRPGSGSVDRVHQLLPELDRCLVGQAIYVLAPAARGSYLISG